MRTARLGVSETFLAFAASLLLATQVSAQTDPLPSWNDGAAKKAIVDFVQATTTQGSAKFVPPAERIATFDNDGTRAGRMRRPLQIDFLNRALDTVRPMGQFADRDGFASCAGKEPVAKVLRHHLEERPRIRSP